MKKERSFFHTIFTTRPSLELCCSCLFSYATLVYPSFSYCDIDRSDMMCHESKTHVLAKTYDVTSPKLVFLSTLCTNSAS